MTHESNEDKRNALLQVRKQQAAAVCLEHRPLMVQEHSSLLPSRLCVLPRTAALSCQGSIALSPATRLRDGPSHARHHGAHGRCAWSTWSGTTCSSPLPPTCWSPALTPPTQGCCPLAAGWPSAQSCKGGQPAAGDLEHQWPGVAMRRAMPAHLYCPHSILCVNVSD